MFGCVLDSEGFVHVCVQIHDCTMYRIAGFFLRVYISRMSLIFTNG